MNLGWGLLIAAGVIGFVWSWLIGVFEPDVVVRGRDG